MARFRSIGFGKKPRVVQASDPEDVKPDEHKLVLHADTTLMDADVREMYRDAQEAAHDAEDEAKESRQREFAVKQPFVLGFTITLGVLVAARRRRYGRTALDDPHVRRRRALHRARPRPGCAVA